MGSFRAAPEAAVDSGGTWEGGAGSTGTQVACEEAYPVLSRQPRGKAGTSGGRGMRGGINGLGDRVARRSSRA